MTLKELKQKSVQLLSENNIIKDIIYSDDNIETLFSLLSRKSKEDLRNFVMVILRNRDSGEVMYVITFHEFSEFLDIIKAELEKYSETESVDKISVSKFNFEKFKLNLKNNAILKDSLIEDALKIFESSRIEVLPIVDKDNQYVGKIKRSSISTKISELTN